ncbi:MAG: flagellar basal body protein FliL [Rickettsiaceae bacterium]|nr:flagellar basal body protein FliL [Rickettsiaceae bacterium]
MADEKEEKKEGEEAPAKKEEGAPAAEGDAAAEGEGGEGTEGGKKKSKLKIIIIAVVVVIAIAVPAVLYLTGVIGPKKSASVEVVPGKEGEAVVGKDGVIEHSVYYDMEEFVVNLNVGSKRPSFLKMTVSLELGGELQIPRVEEKMPRIRDSFQVYLRELRQEDLQGSSGLYRLREELLLRINKIVYPAKVNDILFKEILVQ